MRPFLPLGSPLGAVRNNVRCSSWAHRKARSGLPISVNWTSFARWYGWGATSDYRFKIGNFAPTGTCWHKISGRRGRPHQPFFSYKTRLNVVSYDVKKADFSSVLLPRCMECRRGLAMRILSVCPSVCPSVCLSNACIVTKRKKNLSRFLYHDERTISVVFWRKEWLVWWW